VYDYAVKNFGNVFYLLELAPSIQYVKRAAAWYTLY
jgi:hypothetical protein